jgi:hypothetical protein
VKNLAKVLLVIGVIALVVGVIAKLMNVAIVGSKPVTILSFADSCFLLAIGLILLEEKK